MEMPSTDLTNKDLIDFLGTWFNHFLNTTSVTKVTNPAELRDEKTIKEESKKTLDALSTISKELRDAISQIQISEPKEEVSISNLKDINIPAQKEVIFPKEFIVSNLKDIVIPEQKETKFPDGFKITNLKDIRIPEQLSEISIKNFPTIQQISGDVNVSQFSDLLNGVQVVVDSVNALDRSIQSIANIPQIVATSMGSHKYTTADPMPVSFSGSITVSGPLAVTQSGTWNLTNISGIISLPTGAATAARQDTGNTSLASIDGKLPSLGQALAASSVPVVLTAAQLSTLTPLSTVAATQSGVWTVGLSAGSNVIGHVILDTTSTTAVTQATGTNLHMVVDSGTITTVSTVSTITNVVHIDDNSGSLTVDNNGTFAVQATLTAETTKVIGTVNIAAAQTLATVTTVSTVTSITNQVDTNLKQIGGTNTVSGGVNGTLAVGGNVATNVAIGTNPVNLGAQGVSSENSAVTTARMVQLVADLVGKLIVLPYANPENFVNGTTAAITDTTSTSVIASAGGSLRNYVTSILVTNSHATVGTFVKILEGSNIIYEGYAAAAGGGFSVSLPVPLRGAAATAINAQLVTTGANVIASCAGYKGV